MPKNQDELPENQDELDHKLKLVGGAALKGAGVVTGSVFSLGTVFAGIGYAAGDWLKNWIYGSDDANNPAPSFDEVYWYPILGALIVSIGAGAVGLAVAMPYLERVINSVVLKNNGEIKKKLLHQGVSRKTLAFLRDDSDDSAEESDSEEGSVLVAQQEHLKRVKAATIKGARVVAGTTYSFSAGGAGIGYAAGDWLRKFMFGSVTNNENSSADYSPASFETYDPYNVSSNPPPSFNQVYWYPIAGAFLGALAGGLLGLGPSVLYMRHLIKAILLKNNQDIVAVLKQKGVGQDALDAVFSKEEQKQTNFVYFSALGEDHRIPLGEDNDVPVDEASDYTVVGQVRVVGPSNVLSIPYNGDSSIYSNADSEDNFIPLGEDNDVRVDRASDYTVVGQVRVVRPSNVRPSNVLPSPYNGEEVFFDIEKNAPNPAEQNKERIRVILEALVEAEVDWNILKNAFGEKYAADFSADNPIAEQNYYDSREETNREIMRILKTLLRASVDQNILEKAFGQECVEDASEQMLATGSSSSSFFPPVPEDRAPGANLGAGLGHR